ncbi:DUF1836 domain-containing protein [Oceanobacillus halophilus]|uniref:DUF1836 domain-containing protein n=1 Tax=Oceanobacillus halophilus TaxID=930130 RepID=A0A495A6P0_9BACI|nr:DUF1836 domain-containing protein [Oceanobacillus halophilus]RKQ35517.1 DUF1836 domain-containing protein [Oceanobacillus halophilus]
MENIRELIKELNLDTNLTTEDIPEIDLYMDQVIQLFESKYESTKRNEHDKVLTKTMINNYAKGKLFFPVKNKRYTKEHIMLISLIYQLKSALSINDIKKSLTRLNSKVVEEEFELENLYKSYETLSKRNVEHFAENVLQINQEVAAEVPDDEDNQYMEQLLLIASFTHMGNLYRKAAEKIVDEIADNPPSSNEK